MSRATPEMRDFARRLIAFETRGARVEDRDTPGAFLVCEKLRPHLATLMGRSGVRALVGRALALATVEAPALRAVQIHDDGSLEVIDGATAEMLEAGGTLLVAELLALLEAFIGEALTLRMLRGVWPRLSFSALYFRPEDQK